MSRANDGKSDMTALLLDDNTTESLLAGEPVDLRFAALESVMTAMRDAVPIDAPEPKGELAALLASPQALAEAVGATTTDVVEAGHVDRAEVTPKVAARSMRSRASRAARAAGGLGLVAKIALGTGAAAAAVGGAGQPAAAPTDPGRRRGGDAPGRLPERAGHAACGCGQGDGRGSGSAGSDSDGVTPSTVSSTTAGSSCDQLDGGDGVGPRRPFHPSPSCRATVRRTAPGTVSRTGPTATAAAATAMRTATRGATATVSRTGPTATAPVATAIPMARRPPTLMATPVVPTV